MRLSVGQIHSCYQSGRGDVLQFDASARYAHTNWEAASFQRSQDIIRAERIRGPTTMLRNDSLFPQQRLLVRDDVELFLANAFHRDGVIRAVLHGLPGIGYS